MGLADELEPALKPEGLAALVARGVELGAATLVRKDGALLCWWYPEPERCEVIAAIGSLRQANWALDALGADMRAKGATRLSWTGGRAWDRVATRLYAERRH